MLAEGKSLRELLTRMGLNVLLFAIACSMYARVFDVVGYMYDVPLRISWPAMLLGVALLVVLTVAGTFRSTIYRHAFDVCILGLFLPVAVVCTQVDVSWVFMLYPFAVICLASLGVRLAETVNLRERIGHSVIACVSFPQMRGAIVILYLGLFISLIASNLPALNFNLVQIYLNTYVIRSEQEVAGILGYLIGWFVLVFFPLFLSDLQSRTGLLLSLLVLAGALVVFQAFATKVIFLNFFMVAAFAFALRGGGWLAKYFPQVFFLSVFGMSWLIGDLASPLLDRFFYLIGLTTVFYLDYFSQFPLRYFEGTKLDMGLSNYGTEVGYVIDNAYYGGGGTNQSSGFIPTMYSDLGLWGVLVFAVVLGVIMAMIASLQSVSRNFAYLAMIALSFALMNHSFNMLFLSNGLGLLLLGALLLRRGGQGAVTLARTVG